MTRKHVFTVACMVAVVLVCAAVGVALIARNGSEETTEHDWRRVRLDFSDPTNIAALDSLIGLGRRAVIGRLGLPDREKRTGWFSSRMIYNHANEEMVTELVLDFVAGRCRGVGLKD